jgi:hypothetical protein
VGDLRVVAVYGIAALLCIALVFVGTRTGQLFGLVLAPICLLLSIGIGWRINLIRQILVVLLALAILADVLFFLFFVAAFLGITTTPAHIAPLKQMIRIPFRIGPTLAMLYYLMRPDVREAFVKRMSNKDATRRC